jgi:hypothetical protein
MINVRPLAELRKGRTLFDQFDPDLFYAACEMTGLEESKIGALYGIAFDLKSRDNEITTEKAILKAMVDAGYVEISLAVMLSAYAHKYDDLFGPPQRLEATAPAELEQPIN